MADKYSSVLLNDDGTFKEETKAKIADAVTEILRVESNLRTEVETTISDVSPLTFYPIYATSLFAPRPSKIPAGVPALWIMETNSQYPAFANAIDGDIVFRYDSQPVAFNPSTIEGIFAWSDPSRTEYADGAIMPTYQEQGPLQLTLAQWTINSQNATQTPVLAKTAFSGTPAVNYISRSGHSVAITVPTPQALVFAANIQFTGALPASANQHANSMGNNGKYSIQRTPGGKWAASVDGDTNYEFGTCDNLVHSWVLVATKTRLQVWRDGVKVLDQALALGALPAPSIWRFGYVSLTLGLAMGGGYVGDAFGACPSGEPSAADIATYTTFLNSRRNV